MAKINNRPLTFRDLKIAQNNHSLEVLIAGYRQKSLHQPLKKLITKDPFGSSNGLEKPSDFKNK